MWLFKMPAWVSSSVHRSIIAALIEARKSAGMTQREVAAKIGKPPSFVGKVEAIERNLSIIEFVAWANAIGSSGHNLLESIKEKLPDRFEI